MKITYERNYLDLPAMTSGLAYRQRSVANPLEPSDRAFGAAKKKSLHVRNARVGLT